jgi:hypothetical protein
MELCKITVDQSDKKSLNKQIKDFNLHFKKSNSVVLDFIQDTFSISDIIYFFNNLNCSWEAFKEKVTINHSTPEQIFGIAFDVWENRNKERKLAFIKAGTFLLSIIVICTGLYYGYNWLNKAVIKPYMQTQLIEDKIWFLIKDQGLESWLKVNYAKHNRDSETNKTPKLNEDVKTEIHKLAKAVYSAQTTYQIPHNTIICYINAESDFWKYSTSNVPIKDNWGNMITNEHCYGYSQIYLKIWGEVVGTDCKIFEPEENIYWGGYILKLKLTKNSGDLYKSLYNYNGGKFTEMDSKHTVATTESFNYTKRILNISDRLAYYESLKR